MISFARRAFVAAASQHTKVKENAQLLVQLNEPHFQGHVGVIHLAVCCCFAWPQHKSTRIQFAIAGKALFRLFSFTSFLRYLLHHVVTTIKEFNSLALRDAKSSQQASKAEDQAKARRRSFV